MAGTLRGRNVRTFLVGAGCLGVGYVVYVIARPPTALDVVPRVPVLSASLPPQMRAWLGPVPTFIHTLAFSLMTASLVNGNRAWQLAVCGAWAAVEIFFEIVQHPSFKNWILDGIPLVASMPYMGDYLAHGTFDAGDIAAAVIGAGCAALFLHSSER